MSLYLELVLSTHIILKVNNYSNMELCLTRIGSIAWDNKTTYCAGLAGEMIDMVEMLMDYRCVILSGSITKETEKAPVG